jgi:hypothetical protein
VLSVEPSVLPWALQRSSLWLLRALRWASGGQRSCRQVHGRRTYACGMWAGGALEPLPGGREPFSGGDVCMSRAGTVAPPLALALVL